MTVRVAELWRSQGDVFLARHHLLVQDDLARLRGALVVVEDDSNDDDDEVGGREPGWHDRLAGTVARLRGWDDAMVERLRLMHADEAEERETVANAKSASRPGAVVDLTGPEVIVHVPEESAATCRRCRRDFEPERLVHPFGDHKPPLCIACARDIAGFRTRSRR